MKKILAFILLIIVTLTAFTPCCPADNCQDEIALAKQQNNDQDSEGNCSPFNSCTSCPGFTVTIKNFTIHEAIQVYPEYHSSDIDFFSSIHTSSLWQPPRDLMVS